MLYLFMRMLRVIGVTRSDDQRESVLADQVIVYSRSDVLS